MKKTRKMVASLVAIVICFAMLLGTTYAWFTDSVINTNNIIKSGDVNVELYHTNKVKTNEKVDGATKLFVNVNGDPILWEPGASASEDFQIKNEGTLALKYEFRVKALARTFTESGKALSEILTLKVTGEGEDKTQVFGDGYIVSGNILAGKDAKYTVSISWTASENDNDYNVKEDLQILLGIELVATQFTVEEDGTDNQFDVDSALPDVSTYKEIDQTAPAQEVALETKGENPIKATVPAAIIEALPDTVTSIAIAHTEPIVDETNKKVSFESVKIVDQFGNVIDLEELGVTEKVTVTLPAQEVFAEGARVDVYHDGEIVDTVTVGADGVITYNTAHFSEVTVQSSFAPGSVFKGENPVDLKPEVFEANPNLIAINYVQEGQTCYVIADKTKTKVLAASDTPEYISENGGYEVVNASGKLYSIISGLQNNEHSTVYLLPGTYEEATTIYVYSSMDIIGLGNKEDIKVVKKANVSKSNRHIFNVSGTKSEYIEVTIRNMTLDATAKTSATSFMDKDNGAVQSIRKSKVKCFNLHIKKATDGLYAFYVNGNNAVEGVKYTAYLYAEDCSLEGKSSQIVTTSGTYKFYHNNLTYNNGNNADSLYTKNSGNIKNIVMAENDWDWDN